MYIELYLKSKVGMDSEVLGVKVPLAFLGTGASRYVPRDVIVFPNFPAVFCFFQHWFHIQSSSSQEACELPT